MRRSGQANFPRLCFHAPICKYQFRFLLLWLRQGWILCHVCRLHSLWLTLDCQKVVWKNSNVTWKVFCFFFINPRMEDTWRVTFEILQWHSCVMLHDKHMDRCHAEGLLCLNKGINDACFLTSTLPTGTLRSVSIQLISSIFPCYYSDSP